MTPLGNVLRHRATDNRSVVRPVPDTVSHSKGDLLLLSQGLVSQPLVA